MALAASIGSLSALSRHDLGRVMMERGKALVVCRLLDAGTKGGWQHFSKQTMSFVLCLSTCLILFRPPPHSLICV